SARPYHERWRGDAPAAACPRAGPQKRWPHLILSSFTPELRQRISANLAVLEPRILDAAGLRHAAVGVVLLPDRRGRACFVLTRRLSTLRRHSGQWALPGGRLETGETEAIAALREIQEEVGLDLPADAILGR